MPKEKLTEISDHSFAGSLAKKRNAISYSRLSFSSLIQRLHKLFSSLPDHRLGSNQSKSFNDAAMGAFAIFHTQSPSFLSYQERMRESEGRDNAQSLFGIYDLLSDNHIRDLMDEVPPEKLFSFFLELGFDFIFTCKPSSHRTLDEYLELLKDQIVTKERRYYTGRRWLVDKTRYLNGVPIRDGKSAQEVNWFERITIVEETGEKIYHNSWLTNFEITKANVDQLVIDGRARWKIENENNNVLKTKGYHLEHNFGHGKNHLAQVFLTLNLLAFLIHTIQEMVDAKYYRLFKAIGNRKTFFNDIKTLTRYLYFSSWENMIITSTQMHF